MADYITFEENKIRMFKIGKFSFSSIEIRHLLIAFIMINITFMSLNRSSLALLGLVNFIIVFTLSVGFGFAFHEIAHKLVAQHFGYISEFRADFMMLAVSFFLAFTTGFGFLAPGAVLIAGRLSIRENGIISVAGPLVNLTLAILFLLIILIFQPIAGSLLAITCRIGISVNAFLGIFNMIPFWVLDGKKVLAWNKRIYFLVLVPLVMLFMLF